MGKPMALNVLKAGFPLYTSKHKRQSPYADLLKAGAVDCDSPVEVAEESDIIILCLPDPQAVKDIIWGAGQLIDNLKPETILVDTGTTGLPTTKECAAAVIEKNCSWIDAPISGGVWGAKDGTLTFMVGGETAHLNKIMPVLQSMGNQIVHVGPTGSGQAAKLVNNLMATISTAAIGEAFSFGVKAGVDVDALFEVVSHSSGSNWVLEHAAPHSIFTGDYTPGGRLKTMMKDMDLTLELAKEYQAPLLLGGLVYQLNAVMLARGYQDQDACVLAKFYEGELGISLASPTFIEKESANG
jgi:3-hydroxyisobutyrate dehydrogenase-like beta-hydroxyacid dehydrogenase